MNFQFLIAIFFSHYKPPLTFLSKTKTQKPQLQKAHSDSQQNKSQNYQPKAHNNNNQLVKHRATFLNFQILKSYFFHIKTSNNISKQNKNSKDQNCKKLTTTKQKPNQRNSELGFLERVFHLVRVRNRGDNRTERVHRVLVPKPSLFESSSTSAAATLAVMRGIIGRSHVTVKDDAV